MLEHLFIWFCLEDSEYTLTHKHRQITYIILENLSDRVILFLPMRRISPFPIASILTYTPTSNIFFLFLTCLTDHLFLTITSSWVWGYFLFLYWIFVSTSIIWRANNYLLFVCLSAESRVGGASRRPEPLSLQIRCRWEEGIRSHKQCQAILHEVSCKLRRLGLQYWVLLAWENLGYFLGLCVCCSWWLCTGGNIR